MTVQYEIILIACLTAAACAIPGTFLVLRRMSMLSDAISHSMLLGIVAAFFLINKIDSPIMVLMAAMVGILTIFLVEFLTKTRLMKEDAAIGLVYPVMFSIAVIIISLFGSNIHLDVDSVLTGELAYTVLNRLFVNGKDIGPVAFYQIGGVLLLNIFFVLTFYKELKLVIFDPQYAQSIGFNAKKIIYAFMLCVAVTIVVAFEVAGTIMVVGFIVGPTVIASYFTKKLNVLLIFAPLVGIVASVAGYNVAHIADVSIAGTIVTLIGIMFALSFLFAPKRGLFDKMMNQKAVRNELAINMLLVHIWQHETLGDSELENNHENIAVHFNWDVVYLDNIIKICEEKGYLIIANNTLILCNDGKTRAERAIENKTYLD